MDVGPLSATRSDGLDMNTVSALQRRCPLAYLVPLRHRDDVRVLQGDGVELDAMEG